VTATATEPRRLPRLGVLGRLKLAREILGTWIAVHRLPWRRELHAAVDALRGVPASAPAGATDDDETYLLGMRLGYAVTRTLPYVPGENRCLMRSLVLTRLLARRGIESTLVIGVRPAPDFGSHAWVEYEGRPVLPPLGTAYERMLEL
jgi:hypothetical protein